MSLYEVYAMQNVTVVEMKVREGALIKQAKVENKNVSKMKKIVQETKQKSKNWEENKNRCDNVVSLSCSQFSDEGITQEMFSEAKVIRIGDIMEDLRKRVAELEAQVKPSTPLEVLEESRKVATQAVKKIEEAEALCAKAID